MIEIMYKKLEFRHASDNYQNDDRWPFVYLHGEAEFNDATEEAPDLCLANLPMPDIVPETTAHLNCTVRGLPAICVLYRPSNGPTQGRIALLSDVKSVKHARSVTAWR